MAKIIKYRQRLTSITLVIVLIALLLPSTTVYAADYPLSPNDEIIIDALDYLQDEQDVNGSIGGLAISAWAIMAIAAAAEDPHEWGEPSVVDFLKDNASSLDWNNATDLERSILAICAAGEDPTDFGGEDYIGALEDLYDGIQIGYDDTLNDDFWGILAFIAAGESPNSDIVENSVQFIIDNQNGDGGWNWVVGNPSDVDNTAAALNALLAAGESPGSGPIEDGFDYLAGKQNSDGGFPAEWITDTTSASCAWAINALLDAGISPDSWYYDGNPDANPVQALIDLQDDDGAFLFTSGQRSNPIFMTVYAIPALLGDSYPVTPIEWQPPQDGLPDLVVTNIDPPRDFYEDVDATISVIISNDGQEDINDNFRVTLSVEGDLEDSISIEELDEGDSIDIDFEWTPSATGEHNILVVVDSDDDIVEEDEDNNDRDIDENVISQPEDADLIISDTDLPDNGYVGVPLSLLVTLTNAGGLEISKDFTVELEVDGKSADSATVSGLDDGRKTDIELEWTPQSTGTYSFKITVDSEDDIDESDEGNNRETLELDIFETTGKSDLQLVHADTQTRLTNGTVGSILVTLSNDSDTDISDSFNLQLRLNEMVVSSVSVASLDAGTSVEMPISYTPDITGAHLFTAIVDPDNIIDESNEDNNHYQFIIEIAPTDAQGTIKTNHETTAGQSGGGISFTKLITEPPPFMVAIVLLGASLIIVLVFFLRQRQRGY